MHEGVAIVAPRAAAGRGAHMGEEQRRADLTGDAAKGAEIAIEHVITGTVQNQAIMMRVRMFYNKKRNYHVQVLYPPGSPDEALAMKFLDSFKLTE